MKRASLPFLCFSLFASLLVKSVVASESLPWGVERIGGAIVWDKYPEDLTVDPGLPAGQGIRVAVFRLFVSQQNLSFYYEYNHLVKSYDKV